MPVEINDKHAWETERFLAERRERGAIACPRKAGGTARGSAEMRIGEEMKGRKEDRARQSHPSRTGQERTAALIRGRGSNDKTTPSRVARKRTGSAFFEGSGNRL